jgi:hypothetical protein
LHDLEDQAFDLIVSILGAMFAPKPFDVAREMKMPGDASGRPLEKEREISPAINIRRFSKLVTRLLFRE